MVKFQRIWIWCLLFYIRSSMLVSRQIHPNDFELTALEYLWRVHNMQALNLRWNLNNKLFSFYIQNVTLSTLSISPILSVAESNKVLNTWRLTWVCESEHKAQTKQSEGVIILTAAFKSELFAFMVLHHNPHFALHAKTWRIVLFTLYHAEWH